MVDQWRLHTHQWSRARSAAQPRGSSRLQAEKPAALPPFAAYPPPHWARWIILLGGPIDSVAGWRKAKMAAPRLRKVMWKKEADNLVDDYVTQGYEILEQGERSTLVRKVSWGTFRGHVLWALLTVWFTAGLGNLVYALIIRYVERKFSSRLMSPEKR